MFVRKIVTFCSRVPIPAANLVQFSAIALQSTPHPFEIEAWQPASGSCYARTAPLDHLKRNVGADATASTSSDGTSRRGTDTSSRLLHLFCNKRLEKQLVRLFTEMIRSRKDPVAEILTVFPSVGKGSWRRHTPVPAVSALMKAYAGLCMPEEALNAFVRLGSIGLLPCVKSCNFLMNFLFQYGRLKNVRVVYGTMKGFGMDLNGYTYAIFIKALCKGGVFQEALGVLREMKEMGLEPDEFVYATLINGWCANGKPDSGYELLKAVRRAGVEANTFSYNCVIHGLCKQGKLQEAVAVLEDMTRNGVVGDASGYGCVIRELCKAGELPKALSIHEDMKSKNIRTNCIIVSSILHAFSELGMVVEALEFFQATRVMDRIYVDEVLYNIAMDAHCKLGNMRKALDLFQEMKWKQLFPDALHYTTMIGGCCRKGELPNAWAVFADMLKTGADPDVVTYNTLAGGSCKNGYGQDALDIMDQMLNCGLRPNSISYSIHIEAFCRCGDLNEAERLFESLQNTDVETSVIFSAMVTGYLVIGHTIEAYGLFFGAFEQGTCVDETACSKLISELCNKRDTRRASMVFQKMLATNITPSEISYNKLIAALSRIGDMTKAQHFFDDFVKRGLRPNVVMYTTLINGYCKVNRLLEAQKLFWKMRQNGIKPDVVSYTVLMDADLKDFSRKGAGDKQKGESGYGSTYYELFNEMIKQQIKPDTVCFTVLIDGKMDCLDDALELFKLMVDVGVIPDAVTYTALIYSYCGRGMVEKAKDLVEEMVHLGIQPDSATSNALGQGILKAKKLQLQN